MVRERNAASAALVVAVITLSQWPVVDSSPLQFTIFLYGGVLVTALGIFERVRASRVVGSVWVLFVLWRVYEPLRRVSVGRFRGQAVYGWLEAITVPYQPKFTSWGTSSGVIDSL
mgnify:CR=1 FL=1